VDFRALWMSARFGSRDSGVQVFRGEREARIDQPHGCPDMVREGVVDK